MEYYHRYTMQSNQVKRNTDIIGLFLLSAFILLIYHIPTIVVGLIPVIVWEITERYKKFTLGNFSVPTKIFEAAVGWTMLFYMALSFFIIPAIIPIVTMLVNLVMGYEFLSLSYDIHETVNKFTNKFLALFVPIYTCEVVRIWRSYNKQKGMH